MKFFLIGYYDENNTGDDVCLANTRLFIKRQFQGACCRYLSSKNSDDSVSKYSWGPLFRAIFSCDAVVLGGGGLLQNSTSNKSFLFYLVLIFWAKLCQKKLYVFNQGIGPIKGKVFQSLVVMALKSASYISVRDNNSYRFVSSLKQARITADIAFYSASTQINSNTHLSKVGVALCGSGKHKAVIQGLFKQANLQFKDALGLSFYRPYDEQFMIGLGCRCIPIQAEGFYNEESYELSFLIAMRYHSCVWAGLKGIPFIALAYDPKVAEIAAELGQPCIKLYEKDFDLMRLQELFLEVKNNYSQYKEQLVLAVDKQINRANAARI
jgi:polysaccharide pyruvyl transferase CsaB